MDLFLTTSPHATEEAGSIRQNWCPLVYSAGIYCVPGPQSTQPKEKVPPGHALMLPCFLIHSFTGHLCQVPHNGFLVDSVPPTPCPGTANGWEAKTPELSCVCRAGKPIRVGPGPPPAPEHPVFGSLPRPRGIQQVLGSPQLVQRTQPADRSRVHS